MVANPSISFQISKEKKKKLIPDTLQDFFLWSKGNNFVFYFFEIVKLFDFCVYKEMRDRKSGRFFEQWRTIWDLLGSAGDFDFLFILFSTNNNHLAHAITKTQLADPND